VPRVLADVLLDELAASAVGVPGIQDLDDHVTAVQHLVQLTPDALGLALLKDRVPGLETKEERMVGVSNTIVDKQGGVGPWFGNTGWSSGKKVDACTQE